MRRGPGQSHFLQHPGPGTVPRGTQCKLLMYGFHDDGRKKGGREGRRVGGEKTEAQVTSGEEQDGTGEHPALSCVKMYPGSWLYSGKVRPTGQETSATEKIVYYSPFPREWGQGTPCHMGPQEKTPRPVTGREHERGNCGNVFMGVGQDRVRGLTRPRLAGVDNFSGSVGAATSCLTPDPGPVREGKGLVSQQRSSPDKAGGLGVCRSSCAPQRVARCL